MSTLIETGTIEEQISKKDVEYTIYHGLNSIFALRADNDWLTFNFELVTELKKVAKSEEELLDLVQQHQFEDFHWRWVDKSVSFSSTEYEWFYLLIADQVQGICLIYHPKPSRIDGQNIFYVDYVAVAPWNRDSLITKKIFKGIGTILIKRALIYSINVLGYRPGFSLHSLPQAVTYYEKIGMINFGPDGTKQNLHYFEMEPESSEGFAHA